MLDAIIWSLPPSSFLVHQTISRTPFLWIYNGSLNPPDQLQHNATALQGISPDLSQLKVNVSCLFDRGQSQTWWSRNLYIPLPSTRCQWSSVNFPAIQHLTHHSVPYSNDLVYIRCFHSEQLWCHMEIAEMVLELRASLLCVKQSHAPESRSMNQPRRHCMQMGP